MSVLSGLALYNSIALKAFSLNETKSSYDALTPSYCPCAKTSLASSTVIPFCSA